MLQFTQTASKRNKDKSLVYHRNDIPAVYFQYGALDKTEEKTNTIKYLDTTSNKIVSASLKYTQPVFRTEDGDLLVSKVIVQELLQETIAYFQAKNPNVDAIWQLLDKATDGENAALKVAALPKPEKSAEQIINELAESLMLMPKYKGKETLARAAAKAMFDASGDDE